ncbi:type 4a pilus biogenesis protein PilO [Rubrobacter indicoceani]|uniref:type 4a pilus biogenesis protein PilO n=1 Tax=Rubrobacter indicoceani TaxID=2051957 RepID=UPI0013C50071|nr:type 4a pilus biogenesis protein PilO [Rubrobacter indicoceani]
MSGRSLVLIGLGILLLLILLGYLLVVGPLLGRLSDRAEERDAKEAQVAQLQAQVQDLERVRDNSGELGQRILELNKRVPSEPEIPTFVVQLQQIAGAAGVTQVRIEPGTPGAPPQGGPYSVVPITMTFEGTYEGLRDFLLRCNDLVRLVTINSVAYEPIIVDAGEEDLATGVEPILNVEIEAEIYFQPEGDGGGAAPISPEATTGATETTTVTEETTVAQ